MFRKNLRFIVISLVLVVAGFAANNIYAIGDVEDCGNIGQCDWSSEVAVAFECFTDNCTDGAAHTCILCLPEDQEGED